jgi:hypothetical protein
MTRGVYFLIPSERSGEIVKTLLQSRHVSDNSVIIFNSLGLLISRSTSLPNLRNHAFIYCLRESLTHRSLSVSRSRGGGRRSPDVRWMLRCCDEAQAEGTRAVEREFPARASCHMPPPSLPQATSSDCV